MKIAVAICFFDRNFYRHPPGILENFQCCVLNFSKFLIKKLKFMVIFCYFSTFPRGTFAQKQTALGFLKNSCRKADS